MATTVTIIPAGVTTVAAPLLLGQNLIAGPTVQGGTVVISTAPTQSGPFNAVGAATGSAQSVRGIVNQWYIVTTSAQAATVVVSDITNLGANVITMNSPIDSANVTAEVVVFTMRIPPNVLTANCRVELSGRMSLTNNVNAKTMQCRMNGLAGTLFHQSAALASLANYNFIAGFSGIGDGATLKGYGAGAGGGLGTSATAFTTLAQNYLTTETEIVVTVTKAVGTDTAKLDSVVLSIF